MRCSILSDFAGEPLAGTAATATALAVPGTAGPVGPRRPAGEPPRPRTRRGTATPRRRHRRAHPADPPPRPHADNHYPPTPRRTWPRRRPAPRGWNRPTSPPPRKRSNSTSTALGAGHSTAFGTPVRRPAAAGLHEQQTRRVLRPVRPADRHRPEPVGVHPHRRPPLRPHRRAAADRPPVRAPRPRARAKASSPRASPPTAAGAVPASARAARSPRSPSASKISETRDVLTVIAETHDSAVVRHADGREWHVALTEQPVPPRPSSCGKSPDIAIALVATAIDELVSAWRG